MNSAPSIAPVPRWHLLFGLTCAAAGMVLGIVMASTKNHVQHVTHAHLLLLGFVVSLLYAMVYQLWLPRTAPRVAGLQTILHQAGTLVIVTGLYLMFGGHVGEATLGPVLGTGSLCALAAALLMLYQVFRVPQAAPGSSADAIGARSA